MVYKKRKLVRSKPSRVVSPPDCDNVLYVGVDISLVDTGFTMLLPDRSVVKAISLKTKSDRSDLSRITFTAESIAAIVQEYSGENVVRVCFEEIPFSKRPTGKLFTRTAMYWLSVYLLSRQGIECYSIGSTTLKKRFTGAGTAEKADVMNTILDRYGVNIKNDNVADAFGCASILISHLTENMRLPITKFTRLDALQTFTN